MRYLCPTILASAAMLCTPAGARTAPAGTITCAVDALSARDQTRLGNIFFDRSPETSDAIQQIRRAAAACGAKNHWAPAQVEHAAAWTTWKLDALAYQRKAELSDGDVAIIREWVDEDPDRIADVEHFTSAQQLQLLAAVRQRGAHPHDSGPQSLFAIAVTGLQGMLRTEEAAFAQTP